MKLLKEKFTVVYLSIIIFFCMALPSIGLIAFGANLVEIYENNKLYELLRENWISVGWIVVDNKDESYASKWLIRPMSRGFSYTSYETLYKFLDSDKNIIYNYVYTDDLEIWSSVRIRYDPLDSSKNMLANNGLISLSWAIGLMANQLWLFIIFSLLTFPMIPKFYKRLKRNIRLIKKA